MAFEETLSMSDLDLTVKIGGVNPKTKKPNPTQIEGYYIGTKTIIGKKGPSQLHGFKTEKGLVGVWGTKQLNDKLGQLKVGICARVTFKDMLDTNNGPMYTYKVESDKDNCIVVNQEFGGAEDTPVQAQESNNTVSGSGSFTEVSDEDYEETSVDEDPAPLDDQPAPRAAAPRRAAVAPSPDKTRSVADLLNRAKANSANRTA